MSSPASSWWEASLAESSGLRGSTEMASSRQHPNSLQGWLGLLSLAATLPALSFCEPAPAQPGHHLEVQSISLLCWITRGGKQAVPVQSEAPVQCGCCGVSTPQDPNAQWCFSPACYLGRGWRPARQHGCPLSPHREAFAL